MFHSGKRAFNDQDDESDLDHWPQSTLKQSRLMIWIDRLPYLGLIIRALTAIALLVLSNLFLRKPIATNFPRDN